MTGTALWAASHGRDPSFVPRAFAGISLNLDQWAALKQAQIDIDAAIARIKG